MVKIQCMVMPVYVMGLIYGSYMDLSMGFMLALSEFTPFGCDHDDQVSLMNSE